jgi:colanic acid biosynthesis glycosyl transferase WcaI
MKILIATQVFFPDNVSVSQHLSDFAQYLVENGHQVTVISSKFPYDNTGKSYTSYEKWSNVSIFRKWQTRLGKSNVLYRLIDFCTFNLNFAKSLLFFKKTDYDVILCTTSPPFLSYLISIICKIKNKPFVYWVMDLQPELSIASGLIKENSASAIFFKKISKATMLGASKIISLDRFMTNYILSKNVSPDDVITIPVWPVIESTITIEREKNPFRIEHNFGDKIVIMFSGNHALVHPMDTLLEAAKELNSDSRFLFVFIGNGVRKNDVSAFKERFKLNNIVQLPFQPRENIHNSLGSADLHVVILGNGQVGYTHPNKIYGALFLGKPVLYIGPKKSHVTDIINTINGNISVEHGEIRLLIHQIIEFAEKSIELKQQIGIENMHYATEFLSPESLKNKTAQVFLDEINN